MIDTLLDANSNHIMVTVTITMLINRRMEISPIWLRQLDNQIGLLEANFSLCSQIKLLNIKTLLETCIQIVKSLIL